MKWINRHRNKGYRKVSSPNTQEKRCLNKEDAYVILKEQFYSVKDIDVDLNLIDDCLNTILPDWKKLTADSKQVVWEKIIRSRKEEKQNVKTRTKAIPIVVYISLFLLAISFIGTTISYALGYDVFQYVIDWTLEFLNIHTESCMSDSETDQHNGKYGRIYDDMAETLSQNNIFVHLPMWIPEQFKLDFLDTCILSPELLTIDAYYKDEMERGLTISILSVSSVGQLERNIEKNFSQKPEVYNEHEICFYIVNNFDAITVTWIENNFNVIISGNINHDDAIKIIQSIDYEEEI